MKQHASTSLSSVSLSVSIAAYIAHEVAYHQVVNAALQDLLIPSASNPDLKALLETGLKIFQGHLAHAQMLAEKVK